MKIHEHRVAFALSGESWAIDAWLGQSSVRMNRPFVSVIAPPSAGGVAFNLTTSKPVSYTHLTLPTKRIV